MSHALIRLTAGLLPLLPATGLAQAHLGLKTGYWQPRHCPRDWVLYESPHYQIQSQADKDKAKRLADHMEAMFKTYTKLFPASKSFGRRYAVKLLKDRKEFVAYSGKGGAAGYYSPTEQELVLFDTGKWGDEEDTTVTDQGGKIDVEALRRAYDMDILGVAAHEGWHQYFHWYVVSWVYLPSWINEGMGDYFYTAVPRKVKGTKLPAELGRLNPTRLPVIRRAVQSNTHVPIEKLLHYSQSDYYSNAGVCYAEGWALCHFLLHGGNEDYARIVPEFIRAFRETKSWEKNTERIFRRIDLAKLEQEFIAWVKEQKTEDPMADAVKKLLERRRQGQPDGGEPPPDPPDPKK